MDWRNCASNLGAQLFLPSLDGVPGMGPDSEMVYDGYLCDSRLEDHTEGRWLWS